MTWDEGDQNEMMIGVTCWWGFQDEWEVRLRWIVVLGYLCLGKATIDNSWIHLVSQKGLKWNHRWGSWGLIAIKVNYHESNCPWPAWEKVKTMMLLQYQRLICCHPESKNDFGRLAKKECASWHWLVWEELIEEKGENHKGSKGSNPMQVDRPRNCQSNSPMWKLVLVVQMVVEESMVLVALSSTPRTSNRDKRKGKEKWVLFLW